MNESTVNDLEPVPAQTSDPASNNENVLPTLGGQNDEVDYHPLALDHDQPGIWGWIDRASERVSGWLNPILIKEARPVSYTHLTLPTIYSV